MLEFDITENPSWRSDVLMTTSEMIDKVIEYTAKSHCNSREIDWVKYGQRHSYEDDSHQRSLNLSEAMNVLDSYRKDMNEETDNVNVSTIRYMTVDIMCEMHRALGTRNAGGNLRTSVVQTQRPDSTTHWYPQPHLIKDLLYMAVDRHNEHVERYIYQLKHSEAVSEREKLIYLVKCAAWFFCSVISLHPFANGNGRLCRLLANDVLIDMVPFPVPMYNMGQVTKDDYFCAIMQCQDSTSQEDSSKAPEFKNPQDFCALLVDGLWYGIKELSID